MLDATPSVYAPVSARTHSSNQAEGGRGEEEAEHQNAGDKNTVSNGLVRAAACPNSRARKIKIEVNNFCFGEKSHGAAFGRLKDER